MKPVNFICFKCKHFNDISGGCLAFSDGIPESITSGLSKHKKPSTGQKNNIVFTAL
jgi:hypothetical protein